ncbi:MAG: hypothetical protein IMY70_02205, partial [Bacteroidetes bacterium]|nr:hypothetical protein [Bacteroidota bacterium]
MKYKILIVLFVAAFSLISRAQPKPPVIQNDHVSLVAGFSVTVNVLLNDYGEEGDTIVIILVNPQFGHVNHDDSTITYTSDIYFYGIDSVQYIIRDINNGLYSEKGYLVVDIANNNFDSLDISNISAMFYAWGSHFWDATSHRPGHFYVPKHTRKSTFFSNSFWIGGLDENDGLHLAGERYRQIGTDFWIGPVS